MLVRLNVCVKLLFEIMIQYCVYFHLFDLVRSAWSDYSCKINLAKWMIKFITVVRITDNSVFEILHKT